MKYLKITSVLFILASVLCVSGCQDEFADINTDPSTISTGDVNLLFTQALIEFEPSDYTFWFYNAPMMYKWGEIAVGNNGYTNNYLETTAYGGQGSQTYDVLVYKNEIEHLLDQMSQTDADKYQQQVAALNVLCVYLGIFDTDMYGDMPYNEACLAKYTNPSILAPSFDKVEDLYYQWLEELEDNIETLTTAEDQTWVAKQDILYGGDTQRWAKLANSLRLKIAVRLITQDLSKAIEIAQDVASSTAGVLDGENDDFLFNKVSAVTSNDGDNVYHFGNEVLNSYLYPTQLVTDFMLQNQDPRIRFFFTKNDYNSKVVQAFFDQGKELPDFVAANVEYTEDAEGNKTFTGWSGLGEPWVRYYGLPSVMDAYLNSEYDGYFNTTPYTLYNSDNVEYTYTAASQFNAELVEGRLDYTVPTAPDDAVITDTENAPWYGMYMSTSEVNLYFAEFALLGATLPETAEYYYNKGVEASVREYDRLAELNQIPYYGTTYGYDANEKVIDLQDGEIETMMAQDAVAFTGTTNQLLEKVRIQEILHFMYAASDQFNVIRRSGIPSKNSSIFKWVDFSDPVSTDIPRRFEVKAPSVTDLMYENKKSAYEDQGYTVGIGIATSILNSERVWQDKGAPNFGEGVVE